MPVAYTIDPEHRLIYNRVSGPVTRGVLDVVREANTRDARFDATFDIILDITDADIRSLRTADVVNRAQRNDWAPAARRVLVTSTPEQFGLGRLFQSYRTLVDGNAKIFVCSSMAAALEWLGIADFVPSALIVVEGADHNR
jgi:hypothetical protein